MASLAEIEFNYTKAMKQVAELESIASELKKVSSSQINDCLKNVKTNWKGDNSDAYVGKGNKLKIKVTKTAGDISKAASTLSTIAANIKAAEMANIAIIQNRTLK